MEQLRVFVTLLISPEVVSSSFFHLFKNFNRNILDFDIQANNLPFSDLIGLLIVEYGSAKSQKADKRLFRHPLPAVVKGFTHAIYDLNILSSVVVNGLKNYVYFGPDHLKQPYKYWDKGARSYI